MKKFYVMTVVSLLLTATGIAQKYTWTGGGPNANWTTAANWSGGATYPQLTTDSTLINIPAIINLDQSVSVRTLQISAAVKITGTGGGTKQINISGTTTGLQIDAGAKLESDATGGTEFIVNFNAGSKGSVNGEWLLSGDVDANNLAYFLFPEPESGMRLTVNSGGKITIGPLGFLAPNENVGDNDLVFNAGSVVEFKTDGAAIPFANYDPASTIILSGLITAGVSFDEKVSIGNLTYNCPLQSTATDLNMFKINIFGNLLIQGTNGNEVSLIGVRTLPDAATVGINGNFIISGNSVVVVSKQFDDKVTTLTVQGNFVAGGTVFDLQSDNLATLPTNLVVRGNFTYSSGSFGASSTNVSQVVNLFNVEFNGTTLQSLTAYNGSLDNLTNNRQLTLRVNNSFGLNLQSNISVGRVDFNTVNKGIINTGTNTLSIQNPDAGSVQGSSPAGYVEGTLSRATLAAASYEFPTGVGGTVRKLTLTPANALANTFTVNLKTGNNGGAVQPPLSGLAPYYWVVSRSAGTSPAAIALNLSGAIAGASAIDTLVAVAYDGASTWMNVRGTTGAYIYPGNSTAGNVSTVAQTSFSAFTIGYVLNSALPIKLLSFTGKKGTDNAVLFWKITDNSTPAKFEIIKSADGKNFVAIGAVSGLEGKLNYSFTDNSLVSGNNYYRLKMFDIDGTVSYSSIIVIMNGSNGVLISSMIPTLVKDRARLNVSSSVKGSMQLVITDITGRIIRSQAASIDVGNQEIWIDAVSLSPGMFQITGYMNGAKTTTFRFIKQ